MKKLITLTQFWAIWSWMRINSIQILKFKYVWSMPYELKEEFVRMWKAPTIQDDEIF